MTADAPTVDRPHAELRADSCHVCRDARRPGEPYCRRCGWVVAALRSWGADDLRWRIALATGEEDRP